MTHSPLMPDCKPTVVCFFSTGTQANSAPAFGTFPVGIKTLHVYVATLVFCKKVSTCRARGSLWII